MTITSDADKLRLAIGDTDSANYIFNDEEIAVFVADEASFPAMKLAAVEAGALKLARAYDFATDGQTFWRSQMSKAFADIAKQLRAAGVTTTASSVNGISTIAATRVDGYSQDIDSEEVHGGTAGNPRQNFYVVGGIDYLP